MLEEWKSIKGYEGLYEVSNLGRVRSLDHSVIDKNGVKKLYKGRVLNQTLNEGYLRVKLGRTSRYVHILVAEAFVNNPESKPEVDHIDTDRTNNKANNLQWVTHKENMNNPITRERHLDSIYDRLDDMHENCKVRVLCVTTGKVFDSIKEAAEYYKCEKGHISKVCKGKRKTCGSLPDGTRLTWKYIKQNNNN